MKTNTKNAFTIVETLITLLAITIMLLGPLTFMYRSYTDAAFIKNKIIATGLSQEGIELATSLRDSNLNSFKTVADSCANGCAVDWDEVSSTPTFTSCSAETCRLYKSDTDSTQIYKDSFHLPANSSQTDFYRYVKFNKFNADSYTIESISYSYINQIQVSVNLKKVVYNITVQ